MKRLEIIQQIFVFSQLLTRKWEVIANRSYDKNELTLKQLLMLIIIQNAFDHDPTLKEVSHALSTSHQNAKALLLQLEKKDFISLYRDSKDKRVQRIKLSESKEDFWLERNEKDEKILMHLFKDVSEDELLTTLKVISQLDEIASESVGF